MRFLFIGNRKFVLEELLKHTSNVEVVCVEGTHLQKDALLEKINYRLISDAASTHELIRKSNFDILISNGLPYKLKFTELPKKTYINIHPSFLPDLRGIDPVLGSILFKRDSGATCHLMNENFDEGDIISQIKIPFTDDLQASLLYQLSFIAEKQVFNTAWNRDFQSIGPQENKKDLIYFSRDDETRVINFSKDDQEILQVVKAFDNKNQGARFFVNGQEYKTHSAWISVNQYLFSSFSDKAKNSIVLMYEDTIVIKREKTFLFLSKVSPMNLEILGATIG